ncbi:MAG TPA: sigma-70 family RNA polymerase sigma factor [Gemmatimonadaceae bacterium]|nr:sigma-70 family RNA polymerase sigma factor [Gemmatimonadaceae bacterium]
MVSVQAGGALDLQLLQRIVARDAAAVGDLYDRHGSLLFGVIMRILRSRPDAEEVLQEVFIRVWTRAEMYDERLGAPVSWLARLARNRAIDRLRARRARGAVDGLADVHEAEPALAVRISTPEVLAQAAEQSATLRHALLALPEEQRALIEASFFEGYTHSELADRFGLPLGTVKTRIRTGMMTMRERLEDAV